MKKSLKKFIYAGYIFGLTATYLVLSNNPIFNFADNNIEVSEPVMPEEESYPVMLEEIALTTKYTNIKDYIDIDEIAFKKAFESHLDIYKLTPNILHYSEVYRINPFFIASVASLESGYGTSRIARDKNNYFGLRCYDTSPYDSATYYRHPSDSIEDFCEVINNYGDENINRIGEKYCISDDWDKKVSSIMNKYIKNYNKNL